jgi:hypothetical protein
MKRSLMFAAIAFFTVSAACAGPAGPPGRTGTTGAQGSTGRTGAQGESGATIDRSVTTDTDPSGSTVEEKTTITTP